MKIQLDVGLSYLRAIRFPFDTAFRWHLDMLVGALNTLLGTECVYAMELSHSQLSKSGESCARLS